MYRRVRIASHWAILAQACVYIEKASVHKQQHGNIYFRIHFGSRAKVDPAKELNTAFALQGCCRSLTKEYHGFPLAARFLT